MILCVGGKAHGKYVEYIGRTPRIDGDRYILRRVADDVEVYSHAGIGGDEALDRAYRELVKMMPKDDAPNLAAMRLALLNYQETAPIIIEMCIVEAKIKRAKYLALMDAGFTEQQALEIVK